MVNSHSDMGRMKRLPGKAGMGMAGCPGPPLRAGILLTRPSCSTTCCVVYSRDPCGYLPDIEQSSNALDPQPLHTTELLP